MTFFGMILLAGLGTYLMRLLPLISGHKMNQWHPVVTLVLSALGLSAIATLIILSMTGLWQEAPHGYRLASLCIGTGVVLLVLRVFRNVGMATLAGALTYGLADAFLSGRL